MDVVVDYRENDRIEKALDYYGDDTPVLDLSTGDFLFDGKVVFEYKTFEDFLASIKDGRVFNQSISQREAYPYHFVILELGEGFDLNKELRRHYYRQGVSKEQYYGAISRLNTYTTVLPVYGDYLECFRVMGTQAEKCLEEKTLVKHPQVKTGNSALNYLCNNVRRVSLIKGEAITDTLGLSTLEDLLTLTHEDLVSVDGVGDKTADSIIRQIKRDK